MFLKIKTGVKQTKVNLFICSTAFSLRYSFFLKYIPKKMMQNMGTTALKEIQKLFICKSYLANIHKRPVSHTGLSDAITVPDRNDP